MKETQVRSLSWKDPLEMEIATHSSILAWEISWTEEPGGLQSMGLQKSQRDSMTQQQQPPPLRVSLNCFCCFSSLVTQTQVLSHCFLSVFCALSCELAYAPEGQSSRLRWGFPVYSFSLRTFAPRYWLPGCFPVSSRSFVCIMFGFCFACAYEVG